MIAINVTGVEGALKKLDLTSKLKNLGPALKETMTLQTYELQAYIMASKLSGQVLQVQSGTLRRSITAVVTEENGQVRGIVGTNVAYARIHEYGGVINHPGGTPYYLDRNGTAHFVPLSSSLARTLPRTKAHQIPMPERSFLRSGLRDQLPKIKSAVAQTVVRVLVGAAA